MAWEPTTTQYLDMDGVRARGDRFRFDLYNSGERIGQLAPDLERPPVVRWSAESTIMRTLQGLHLPTSELADVNPMTDRVVPVMVLPNDAEEQLGVFLWDTDNRPERPWGPESDANLMDETADLDQGASHVYSWRGSGIGRTYQVATWAAASVAQAVFPSERITVLASSGNIGEPINYPVGTARTRIINEFMKLAGCLPVHVDRFSQLYIRGVPDIANAVPDSTYDVGTRIYADTLVPADEVLTAPNRYTVTSTGGQGTQWKGLYDVPDDAPHSAANRNGRILTHNENVAGLDSQAAADASARAIAQAAGPGYQYWTFQGPADWRHDAFTITRLFGINYLDWAWSITCRSGAPMTHTVRRPY